MLTECMFFICIKVQLATTYIRSSIHENILFYLQKCFSIISSSSVVTIIIWVKLISASSMLTECMFFYLHWKSNWPLLIFDLSWYCSPRFDHIFTNTGNNRCLAILPTVIFTSVVLHSLSCLILSLYWSASPLVFIVSPASVRSLQLSLIPFLSLYPSPLVSTYTVSSHSLRLQLPPDCLLYLCM